MISIERKPRHLCRGYSEKIFTKRNKNFLGFRTGNRIHRARYLLLHLCAIGIFLLLPLYTVDRQTVFASVVINEIFPKPASPDETLEWIELYNNGPETVSLDRWTLQNSSGENKIFEFNTSAMIVANGFLTIPRSQTGLILSNEGDTLRLSDANNSLIDSQSYLSVLGFNTSVGRNVDGSGSWVICETPATPNEPNNCPAPSPTLTPFPSPTPTPSPKPTPTIPPTPTPVKQSLLTEFPAPTTEIISPLAQPEVMGATDVLPTDNFMQTNTYKNLWMSILLLALFGLLVMVTGLYKTTRKRHRE